MTISEERLDVLKNAAKTQMSFADMAGLLSMDEAEFNGFLEENDEIRRTLLRERAEGKYNLAWQLFSNGLSGTNYPALRDAIKALCGFNLDAKTSTKVEINTGPDIELAPEDMDPDRLRLLDKIDNTPLTKEKYEEIYAVLRK